VIVWVCSCAGDLGILYCSIVVIGLRAQQ